MCTGCFSLLFLGLGFIYPVILENPQPLSLWLLTLIFFHYSPFCKSCKICDGTSHFTLHLIQVLFHISCPFFPFVFILGDFLWFIFLFTNSLLLDLNLLLIFRISTFEKFPCSFSRISCLCYVVSISYFISLTILNILILKSLSGDYYL